MEAITHFAAFLAGLGSGFAFKMFIDARKQKINNVGEFRDTQGSVSQKGNTVGGNLAGRDVKTTRDP